MLDKVGIFLKIAFFGTKSSIWKIAGIHANGRYHIAVTGLLQSSSGWFKFNGIIPLPAGKSRYYDQETWNTDLILREEGYDLMLTILEESGVLSGAAPYEDLVNTDFAEKASTP